MVTVKVNGQPVTVLSVYDPITETLHINGIEVETRSALTISIKTESDSLLARRNRTPETVLRMLKSFKLHTGVRNVVAERLPSIVTDPAAIAPYLLTMSEAQARALFEILYGAGLHCVRDTQNPVLLILWNNHQRDQISYRYSDA